MFFLIRAKMLTYLINSIKLGKKVCFILHSRRFTLKKFWWSPAIWTIFSWAPCGVRQLQSVIKANYNHLMSISQSKIRNNYNFIKSFPIKLEIIPRLLIRFCLVSFVSSIIKYLPNIIRKKNTKRNKLSIG